MLLIAGNCVFESTETLVETARAIAPMAERYNLEWYLKASWDKANRTALYSYRNNDITAIDELINVADSFGAKTCTDFHNGAQVERWGSKVDMAQVPAFLCRQTDLLGDFGMFCDHVNVKKGQFATPFTMAKAVEKVKAAGCKDVYVTERGHSYGRDDLVVDFRDIVDMRRDGVRVIFDATHSTRNRHHVLPLARAAVAVGVDGLFFEVHPRPEQALCDSDSQVRASEFGDLLKAVLG